MTGMNVRQMENTIQQLEAQLNTYRERVRQQDEYLDGAAKATQEIVSACRKFCYKILEPLVASGECSMHELQGSTLPDLIKRAQDAYNVETKSHPKRFTRSSLKSSRKRRKRFPAFRRKIHSSRFSWRRRFKVGSRRFLTQLTKNRIYSVKRLILSTTARTKSIRSGRRCSERLKLRDEPEIADFAKSVVEETATATAAVAVTQGKPKKPERKPMMVDFETYKSQMTPLMWRSRVASYGRRGRMRVSGNPRPLHAALWTGIKSASAT